MINPDGLPKGLKEAWLKFRQKKMDLTTLLKTSAAWALERPFIFKPTDIPKKPAQLADLEVLSLKDLKNLPKITAGEMDNLLKDYNAKRRKAYLSNVSNYHWLQDCKAILPDIRWDGLLRVYENYGYLKN